MKRLNIFSKTQLTYIIFLIILLAACNKKPPIDSNDLDSKVYVDSSLITPHNYLASQHKLLPDTSKPVIIAAHGYTATPFEWFEFSEFLKQQPDTVYISRVLLGGHGRNYEAFDSATWQQWQQPIIDEYKQLTALGFKHISLAGSSTGCPLILNFVINHSFSELPPPEHVFFIDPIMLPTNKMLNFVDFLGLVVPYIRVEPNTFEQRYWYKFRSYNSLKNLNNLLLTCRKSLKQGVTLPQQTKSFTVYKVKTDDSADPKSAALLFNGVHFYNGNNIDTFMLNSNLHVFTRLMGRNSISTKDCELQTNAFLHMYNTIIQK